ncbi:MAG TPA: DUF192 domain-containing protein [Actinomycetales bacterium]|nr:DUF192 domain-containing protein [Actinomycetales bacterium]
MEKLTLVVDGRVAAQVERARTLAERSRGLLGRDGVESGLVIEPASSLHTFGMRFAIDVAFVRRDGTVSAVVHMPRQRLGLWRPRTRWVVETEPGRLEEWGVRRGSRLQLRPLV